MHRAPDRDGTRCTSVAFPDAGETGYNRDMSVSFIVLIAGLVCIGLPLLYGIAIAVVYFLNKQKPPQ